MFRLLRVSVNHCTLVPLAICGSQFVGQRKIVYAKSVYATSLDVYRNRTVYFLETSIDRSSFNAVSFKKWIICRERVSG